jgi:hypothetical protein
VRAILYPVAFSSADCITRTDQWHVVERYCAQAEGQAQHHQSSTHCRLHCVAVYAHTRVAIRNWHDSSMHVAVTPAWLSANEISNVQALPDERSLSEQLALNAARIPGSGSSSSSLQQAMATGMHGSCSCTRQLRHCPLHVRHNAAAAAAVAAFTLPQQHPSPPPPHIFSLCCCCCPAGPESCVQHAAAL